MADQTFASLSAADTSRTSADFPGRPATYFCLRSAHGGFGFTNASEQPATMSATAGPKLAVMSSSRSLPPWSLGVIRFGGHLPKGGYDVPNIQAPHEPAAPPAVY